MDKPKVTRKFSLFSRGVAQCVSERLVSGLMERDGYDNLSIADVGSCVCDIVKNAMKWGNGNVPETTFDLDIELYDDRIEIDVTDRGTKPFDIRKPIAEYPANGTPEELLAYFDANQKIGRDGVALFMHSKVMKVLKSYPIEENGKQVGTRVHMVYERHVGE